jgi:hypothetical protein
VLKEKSVKGRRELLAAEIYGLRRSSEPRVAPSDG